MKIGIDIRTLMDVQYSGVPEYTLRLVRALIKRDTKNTYKLFYNSLFDVSERLPEFDFPNVEIVKTSYSNKMFNYVMQKNLKYPKLDELLGVDLFFMPHINFAAMSVGCKKVITVHDLSFLRYPEFFSKRKNLWHKLINVKKELKKFDLIIAISENTKRDIVELCGIEPEKIKVIHSAVSDKYKVIDREDQSMKEVADKYKLPEKFIFSLGTFEPRKNIISLVRAFEELKEDDKFSEYSLVLAGGSGWKNKEIFKEIEASKFKKDIIVLGYVDAVDKPCLYNLASVFVYPSFYEGFGFPPLEAMACGVPVIVSGTSSLPEIVKEGALMIDPYNYREITQSLKCILSDSEYRDRIAILGLGEANNFSWDKTVEEYLKVLEIE